MTDDKEEEEPWWTGWTCDELTPNLCDDLEVSEDYVNIRGINVKIWKYYSPSASAAAESESSNPRRLPIIAIHGGPAWPHNYMLPLKQQACLGRDIYFYDQAGCGESKLPIENATLEDDFPWLLNFFEYFPQEELPAIIDHLDLQEYHIIGNSWGTVVAQYFALNTTHPGLASIVLSGPLSDGKFYIDSQWDDADGSLGSLPPFVQQRIHEIEAAKQYDSAEYEAIGDILTTKFTLRTAPIPDCFQIAEDTMNVDIYVAGQGPSEFSLGGALLDFNVTGRLHELTDLPVLLTYGKYDTMRPPVVDVMYQELPIVERVRFEKSGHVTMIDEPEKMNRVVADFFDRVEEASRQGGGGGGVGTKFIPKNTAAPLAGDKPVAPSCLEGAVHGSHWLVVLLTVLVAFFVGVFMGRSRHRGNEQYQAI